MLTPHLIEGGRVGGDDGSQVTTNDGESDAFSQTKINRKLTNDRKEARTIAGTLNQQFICRLNERRLSKLMKIQSRCVVNEGARGCWVGGLCCSNRLSDGCWTWVHCFPSTIWIIAEYLSRYLTNTTVVMTINVTLCQRARGLPYGNRYALLRGNSN